MIDDKIHCMKIAKKYGKVIIGTEIEDMDISYKYRGKVKESRKKNYKNYRLNNSSKNFGYWIWQRLSFV